MGGDVIVVGGGVIGLSTAVVLAEQGRRVRVWSRDPAGDTTSAVAGGLWWPYRIRPGKRVGDWSLRSLRAYAEQSAAPDETGVRMVSGVMAGTDRASLGAWASSVPGIRAARADELPTGHGPGIRARIPLVDMPVLLRHLRRRLEAAGGRVELRTVRSLAEAAAECPLVVNCTGLGARDLVPDPDMTPVRGQLVVVENPGVEGWYVAAGPDTSDTVYLLPQPYGLLLGGTAEEGCWDTTPDPAVARAIVRRCSRIRPELEGARVIAHRVGLRPARSQVRLEAETLPGGGRCVHNYGHGGAGVTVAWGCAEEAAGLLDAGAPLR